MNSEKFCLKWNDFEGNLREALKEIRYEKEYFDCTLSCGVEQLQAHKIILSASSPLFRSILRQNPHKEPLIYLKGVRMVDLQAVLDFIYYGEVNVAQEELNSFLEVAEELEVKGLTQNKSQKEDRNFKPHQLPPISASASKTNVHQTSENSKSSSRKIIDYSHPETAQTEQVG